MKRSVAWMQMALVAILNASAFFAPGFMLVLLGLETMLRARFGLKRGRLGFIVFAVITVALNAVLVAWSTPGNGATWSLGPLTFGMDGLLRGARGGLRIAAVVGINLAWLQSTPVPAVLDGLRLPRRITVFLAAVFIAVQDIGRDFTSLVDGRKMTGEWPKSRLARLPAIAGLVTPLLVAAVHRARVRREALQMAGISVSGRFVPLVALTALAVAGRLALVAVPNVSLVHVVIFAGGIVFGPWIAAAAALLSMGLSDLLLSGFLPTSFVNAPAMALVGLLGGALRRIPFGTVPGRIIAVLTGITATMLFSVSADLAEWLLVPEFRGDVPYLQARVMAGLAFNAIPALLHGAIFAMVAGPVQRAFMIGWQAPPQSLPSPIPAMDHP